MILRNNFSLASPQEMPSSYAVCKLIISSSVAKFLYKSKTVQFLESFGSPGSNELVTIFIIDFFNVFCDSKSGITFPYDLLIFLPSKPKTTFS